MKLSAFKSGIEIDVQKHDQTGSINEVGYLAIGRR